ncbi:helix-turn-helix domain-containing protein [Rudanella paleaurantiibacter]|uniref:Helix-turn-helix domain-containing protein n=1 Tax=Rudanella paleaurantiibacter TaxID=2614655 RepID=A0A7J5TZE1_9BACT|nr:helix-turn-helix domain-containing protein [Rudanella paleaurantiibacter]KAB7730473.1 helix-turn-helix domain-containing protein [Rudanella paleaurantiibacter]
MEYFILSKDLIDRQERTLADCTKALKAVEQLLIQQNKAILANQLLNVEAACQYLSVSASTLAYYRGRGLPYYRKGKDGIWFRQGEIDEWLQTGKVNRHTK